jgi:purine-nucleoside phosphorylase
MTNPNLTKSKLYYKTKMPSYIELVKETASFLRRHIAQKPKIGIIIGTGLGDSLASLQEAVSYKYKQIPNFPESTVQSHDGRCVIGMIEGMQVIALQGRLHLYEGYSSRQVTFPIRVMQELGVDTLVITNAAGGLNMKFKAGDIVAVTDHINLTGENPLIGQNEDSWGVRFPDMVSVYNRVLIKLAEKSAESINMDLQKGVYAGLKGPSLETPAETRFLRLIGADAVGFSTVLEVIAAVHAGMKILALSTITNINDPDHPAAYTVDEIIDVAQKAAPRLSTLIQEIIRNLTHAGKY